MIAAGGPEDKAGLVVQPLVTKTIELGRAEVQPLGGGQGVELSGVEGD